VEVAERGLRPSIDASLFGIPPREFDNGNALGKKKEEGTEKPEGDSDRARARHNRDAVEVDKRGNEKEGEVGSSEDPSKTGSGIVQFLWCSPRPATANIQQSEEKGKGKVRWERDDEMWRW
jgi:hypothetical protein